MTVLPDAERVRPEAPPIERIRDAAMRSFATQGFSRTSLRAVAASAGVSLGLVQHHFATKEGLIKAVDDHVLTVVISQITREIPAGTSDSVVEIGERVNRMISESPDIVDYVGRALIDNRPVGHMIFDALLNSGTARWNQRIERGEARRDLDLTWAAVNSLVLALGTFILRSHVERNLPESLTSPAQLARWNHSVAMLLREGYFRRAD
jgi:AcrR family transcriptional regulator